jgi:hypothetical protein
MDITDAEVHEMDKCVLCDHQIPLTSENAINRTYTYSCPCCGKIEITYEVTYTLRDNKEYRFLLSVYNRERDYLALPQLLISAKYLTSIINAINPPKTLSEKLDKLITYLGYQSEKSGNYLVSIKPETDFPLSYAKNPNDFKFHQQYLREQKLIDNHAEGNYLTFAGWKRYEELQRNPSKTSQAFVAMWFGQPDRVEGMKSIFDNGIKKAFTEADTSPKFTPIRIDLIEHNDPIDQKILVEIRRSRFVIADLTGNRGGVYFEAGYALSLGIPVIWMCEKGTKVHFDVGQFSRIEWENENDLYEKLKRRIEGSIF